MPNKSSPRSFSNILEAGSQHKLQSFQTKAVRKKASVGEMITHYSEYLGNFEKHANKQE